MSANNYDEQWQYGSMIVSRYYTETSPRDRSQARAAAPLLASEHREPKKLCHFFAISLVFVNRF